MDKMANQLVEIDEDQLDQISGGSSLNIIENNEQFKATGSATNGNANGTFNFHFHNNG